MEAGEVLENSLLATSPASEWELCREEEQEGEHINKQQLSSVVLLAEF